jgi:hypothetical protein
LFVTSWVNAQIVNIPDANFKAKLLSSSPTNTVAYSNGLAVKIDLNNDNEIQVNEAVLIDSLNVSSANIANMDGINNFLNLKKLICSNNQLTSLNISSLTSLKKLRGTSNGITTVNLSNNIQLEEILLSVNQLQSINIFNLTNLIRLEVYGNQLTSILVNSLLQLQILNVSTNLLTDINILENLNLQFLSCGGNLISSLDVSQNLNLHLLDCNNTILTSLDLSQNTNLQQLNCNSTQFTSFDLSNNIMLNGFTCQDNPTLNYLNIKNGTGQSGIAAYSGTNNLLYVCTDENEVEIIQLILGPLVNVNSYCSFIPGGDFNSVSGTTQIDSSNNGCDITDSNVPFLAFDVSLNGFDTNNYVYSNSFGNYTLFASEIGIFGLTPSFENPTYFNFSPNPATVNIAQIDNTTTIQNFCVTPNSIHPDLEIVIVPVIPARPGFDAIYKIVYKNKGNQTVGGTVNFIFNDAVLDFLSATVIPSTIGTGVMNWVIPALSPFQVGTILVTFNVNSPQEIPAVNIDDVLSFNATIGLASDVMPNDNSFAFEQIVVGSYDPNDITCLQGNTLPMSEMGTYLHYNIRFENTGTAPAENIVVASEIDLTQYNIQSLQIMESSHPVTVKVTGNMVEFIHQGIDLDTGGHGNILLKLKSNNALANDLVINSADIFFDYNFPIVTNDEQTVFADLSKNDFNKELIIQIYPNPV